MVAGKNPATHSFSTQVIITFKPRLSKKPGFFVLKYCFSIHKIQRLPNLPPHQSLIRLKKSPP